MWQIIADSNLPPSPENTRTLENFLDLYDTNKNPFPTLPGHRLSVKQYWKILRSLYTRDNIYQNRQYFFQDHHLTSLEDFETIFTNIPDHLLYIFSMMHLSNPRNVRNNLRYIYSRPQNARRDGRWGLWDYSYENLISSNYSYRSENFTEELLVEFRRIHTQVENIINDMGDQAVHGWLIPVNTSNGWVKMFMNYLSGQVTGVHNHDGSHPIAHSEVARILRDNPEAVLINDRQPGDEPFIRLSCPITKRNKHGLYNVFNYSTSPMRMLAWPLVAKGEVKPLLYGIELEMSSDYTAQQLVDASDEPFFILKQDSSVSGSKRHVYELVTVPMSYKAHKKQWAHWFSNLDYDKFDCTKDTSNGMHIHIGQESFVCEKHKKDFAWFFTQPAHQDFMIAFSERTMQSLNSYAPMPNYRGTTITKAYKETTRVCKDKRGTINYSNKETIEVRLFRGIVSLADVLKNLEFVDSVFYFTLDSKNVTQLTIENYFKWLNTQPRNKYHVLRKYFDANDRLKPHIASAALFAAIFTEKRPDRILEIIAKKNFPITNDHVSLLNKRFKKRVFILNKTTGKMEMNVSNRSPVSFLDRLVEARILGVRQLPKKFTPPEPTPEPEDDDIFEELLNEPTPQPPANFNLNTLLRSA